MLDNLRNQSAFQPEEEPSPEAPPPPPLRGQRKTFDQMTGMNAKQRFVLSVLLLFMVCLLGAMLLLVTDKVVLPF
jgi:hypothetical protein